MGKNKKTTILLIICAIVLLFLIIFNVMAIALIVHNNKPNDCSINGSFVTEEIHYDCNDNIISSINYIYDDNGNVKTEKYYIENGQLDYIVEYEYKKNRINNVYLYDANNELVEKAIYIYSDNLDQIEYYSSDGQDYEISYSVNYKYDDNNNVTKEIKKDSSGALIEKNVYEYEYNEKKQIIKEADINIFEEKYTIEYEYEEDRLILETLRDEDDNIISIINYEYDNSGNNIKCIICDKLGDIEEIIVFKY